MKKILCLFLSITMLLGAFSVTALADEEIVIQHPIKNVNL